MVNIQLQQQQVQVVGAVGAKAAFSNDAAIITTSATEPLATLAAGGTSTYTLFSPQITSKSVVHISIYNGTNSGGIPVILTTAPNDNGSVAVVILNAAGGVAFNGTLKMNVIVFN